MLQPRVLGHQCYSLKAPCKPRHRTLSLVLHPYGTMVAHMGHPFTHTAPLGPYASARRATGHLGHTLKAPVGRKLGQLYRTSKAPCRRSRGTWSHTMHSKSAMQAHMGH